MIYNIENSNEKTEIAMTSVFFIFGSYFATVTPATGTVALTV